MNLSDVPNKIVTCYGGSIAYGTNTPASDVDIRGIFCAEEKAIRTPFHVVREVNLDDQEDGKMYELTNFMKLYCDMNPNILEMLWLHDSSIITSSPVYEFLRSNRDVLLSSKCAFTFSGYAMSQIKRIKGHSKWLNNPQPLQPPLHGEHLKLIQNFTDHKIMSRDFTSNYNYFLKSNSIVHYGGNIFGVVSGEGNKSICDQGDFNVSAKQGSINSTQQPLYIIKYCEQEYKQAKEVHKNYWNWKKNRNPVRAALEEKYGADMKHVAHCVRLMRMAKEILTEGVVRVRRPDAEELLAIRNGAWSYEEVLSWTESMDKEIRDLYKTTELRKTVDINIASKILMEAQDIIWQS